MYLKHLLYPSPVVYVPGSKTEETVQFAGHVAKVTAAVGKKLASSDDITEIQEDEYNLAANSDMRHDLPQVHTKDGTLPHVPAAGELPNPMSKADPRPDVLTDGANPSQ